MVDSAKSLTNHGPVLEWVREFLRPAPGLPASPLPLDRAEWEGVLPWLGWRLQETGMLGELAEETRTALRHSLRRWSLLHLDSEMELERLLAAADAGGLRILAMKGHAVSRTIYPNPACRPTSDFDLLVDPVQLDAVREWIAAMGYTATDPYAGRLWLGAQSWSLVDSGRRRFAADLHWDYSNRMYFRRRLPFAELWRASVELPCGKAALRIPCPVDNLLIACVHLAAFDPGMPLRLIWLLDIYLLMARMDEGSIAFLLERAERACAMEACLQFGEKAQQLGGADSAAPVLEALRARASSKRQAAYQRTLHHRGRDLAGFWARLPAAEKVAFFGDMVRWLKNR